MRNAGVDRGSVEIGSSDSESNSSDNKVVSKSRKDKILSDEALFKKLKNNVTARSNFA